MPAGRLVDRARSPSRGQVPAGRLVDPSLRGRKGARKGHADARVPSSFPPPPGAEGRGHARGRVRQQRQARATGPPAPRVPPWERGNIQKFLRVKRELLLLLSHFSRVRLCATP